MKRQEKILKEYIAEILLTEERLDEGFLSTLKKGAKGIGGSLLGIFKKRGGGELTWAEKEFEKFKQEAGAEFTKKTRGKLIQVLDRFFPDEMLSGVPPEFMNLLKQSLVVLYTPKAKFSTSKDRGETTKEAIEKFQKSLETLADKKNVEISGLPEEDVQYALSVTLDSVKYDVNRWERKAIMRRQAGLGIGAKKKDDDDDDIEEEEEESQPKKPSAPAGKSTTKPGGKKPEPTASGGKST
jgi:hypothetical protein